VREVRSNAGALRRRDEGHEGKGQDPPCSERLWGFSSLLARTGFLKPCPRTLSSLVIHAKQVGRIGATVAQALTCKHGRSGLGLSVMAKIMFVYRGGSADAEDSPEEMQQVMQAWGAWIQGGMEAGGMLDGGDALQGAAERRHGDGWPFR
jgi:hypothetical protein